VPGCSLFVPRNDQINHDDGYCSRPAEVATRAPGRRSLVVRGSGPIRRWSGSVAWAALPDADIVARRVADCGYPQVSLRIGLLSDGASMGGDAPDRVVDAVHIDIWTEAGFASDGSIRDEMADDVTGPVLEAWIHLVRVAGPPKMCW
jgi:hypothetical protein